MKLKVYILIMMTLERIESTFGQTAILFRVMPKGIYKFVITGRTASLCLTLEQVDGNCPK